VTFTALLHDCTVDNLRACFEALDGTKAPGIDGVTKDRRSAPYSTSAGQCDLWIRGASGAGRRTGSCPKLLRIWTPRTSKP